MDFSQFADVKVVDGHVHFRGIEWTDVVLEWMDRVGLAAVNLVSTPSLETVNQNVDLIYLKATHPGRFYASGGLDYLQVGADRARMPDILGAQVRRLYQAGFDGLKLIEGKPTARKRFQIPLDAPEYEGVWATLEELQMPIVCHVADPEEFWDRDKVPEWALKWGWFYGDGTYPTKEALYAEIDRVLARHPTLKLILAHFYFLSADLERAARFLDAHPSVCLDLTPGGEMYNHFTRAGEVARAFFLRYQDRIVYGTDVSTRGLVQGGIEAEASKAYFVRAWLETDEPFTPPPAIPHWLEDDLEAIVPIALPEEALDKIYHGNLERLYGARPALLNREAALIEVARIAEEIEAVGGAEAENPAREVLERLAQTSG
jgi:predicted TIM-barrel fold metal-dependent hydrolase